MLEINNLKFQYGKETIIEDVSFNAKPGEVTAIIGANGAGKTTLLKCISGLQSGQGTIKLCGRDSSSMSRQQISEIMSYLDQGTDCQAELNVYEVILLGRINQLSFKVSDDDMERVEEVMKLMSISQFAHRKITELSGGQRQMVFIAQTLIKEPEILILDEPTSALDLNRQFKLMEFLRQMTREKKFTTLLTLHHLDMAAKYADRIVVIHDGVVYADGAPEEVITEQMLRDVYKVNSEVYMDREGGRHIVAVGAI